MGGLLLLLCAPMVYGQATLSASLDANSRYMWRGEKLSSGSVLQPTVEVAWERVAVTFFGNLDPQSAAVSDKTHFNEADLTVSYAAPINGFDASFGYTFYTFPAPGADGLAWNPTQELYATVAAPLPLQPSLLLAWDFDGSKADGDIQGFYAEVGVGQSVGAWDMAAAVGFDNGYVLASGERNLSHVGFSVARTLAFGPVELTPSLSFQHSLDATYQELFDTNTVYGGLGFAF